MAPLSVAQSKMRRVAQIRDFKDLIVPKEPTLTKSIRLSKLSYLPLSTVTMRQLASQILIYLAGHAHV